MTIQEQAQVGLDKELLERKIYAAKWRLGKIAKLEKEVVVLKEELAKIEDGKFCVEGENWISGTCFNPSTYTGLTNSTSTVCGSGSFSNCLR